MMKLNELELAIQQLKSGEVAGLEAVYLEYKDSLYKFIYRYTMDSDLSKDVVQDAFLKFQKYAITFDSKKSAVKTYLFKMAYQILINKLQRREKWQRLIPFLYNDPMIKEVSTEEKLTVQWAIQQLSEQQRAVILLTYYHDLDQASVADVLQIPVGTVKSRLHSAIKKLKRLLEVEEN